MRTLLRYKPKKSQAIREKIELYSHISEIASGRLDSLSSDILEYGTTQELKDMMRLNLKTHRQAKHNVMILEGGLQ